MATTAQIARIARDWSAMAQEPVRVEEVGGTLYGFGSELGTMRIFRKYTPAANVDQAYSKNLGSWFFSLTPKHGAFND